MCPNPDGGTDSEVQWRTDLAPIATGALINLAVMSLRNGDPGAPAVQFYCAALRRTVPATKGRLTHDQRAAIDMVFSKAGQPRIRKG